MRRLVPWLVLWVSIGCGEDPPAAPTPSPDTPSPEAPPPAAGASGEAPAEPDPTPAPAAAAAPPPTREAIDAAREQCTQGYAAIGRGELDVAENHLRPAVEVLQRATEARDREAYGACLYNYGRYWEETLDVREAREHYRRSLDARPNAIVERRLRELGERETDPPVERWDMLPNQLRRGEGHPCASPASCEVLTLAMAHSGAGRLLRAGVVSVTTEEDAATGDPHPRLFLGFTGPRGAFRWGPQLWPLGREPTLDLGDTTVSVAFRHAIPDHPWLLFVRIENDWQERCCGGSSDGLDSDLAICELTDEAARCYFVEEWRQCEGDGDGTADSDYEPCSMDRRRPVRFDDQGLTVGGEGTRTETLAASGWLGPGTYPWATLFPPPAVEEPAEAADGEPAPTPATP
ncbi:MAG: tetratricopeptide repeat protein [Sandaracinaceae bacterium]|nr:tetratricopeptide repeat protein [Sandaracinaceae bacterium]